MMHDVNITCGRFTRPNRQEEKERKERKKESVEELSEVDFELDDDGGIEIELKD